MRIYATIAQLAAWPGSEPAADGDEALLRSASILASAATVTAWYDVDASGMPTAPAVLEAFADATCTQVTTWRKLKIDPAKGAADAVVSSKSLGSASITYTAAGSASTGRADARAAAALSLCQEAALILADAGLLSRSSLLVYG